MSGDQCKACRFWVEGPNTRYRENSEYGDCRRNPPVVLESVIAKEIPPPRYEQANDIDIEIHSIANATRWPLVYFTDWCGQFERPNQGAAPC